MKQHLSFATALATLGVLLAAAPAALHAQGRIIIPCVPERPCPPPCPRPGCPIPMPGSAIERSGSDVRVVMRDNVLSYEVDERFRNRGGGLGEADYLFPLPRNAAFQDLRLTIDGRLVAGEILGAAEARRIYEEIVRRERDPALVEWMGHGLLRTRIFPIAAGEERRVVVRFQSVAEREGDALRVDYRRGGASARRPQPRPPMPMPMPVPGDARPQRDAPAPSAREEERGAGRGESFVLEYASSERYGRPYSPTHALHVENRGGRTVITARGDAPEVTILIPVRRTSAAAISTLLHVPGGDDGFALITLTPPPIAGRAQPRDVTFVLDVSGSMSGQKMEQARAAGHQLLGTLDAQDRFRLIDFASDVRTFRDEMLPATRANLADAARYLDGLRAHGGTNIEGALREAFDVRAAAGRLPLVLFVTDGAPTVGERDPARLAALAAELRADARLFTFGVGADVNAQLVERLALEGRGTAHFVAPDESVERTVSVLASRLTAPVATNVRVRGEGGVRLSRTHPDGPVDLFAGQDLILFTRISGSGAGRIVFEGDSPGGRVRWTSDVRLPERERDNEFIPRLWATQRVGWLSAERRSRGANPELDQEIRDLGERYGIPTELTSYFVPEPGMIAGAGRDARLLEREALLRTEERLRRIETQAAPPAPATAGVGAQEFAAARRRAEQRAATTLADVDAAPTAVLNASSGRMISRRAIGDRVFELRDSVWTDVAAADTLPRVRVQAYSAAYFAVLELVPELARYLAAGDRVVVAGRRVAVEVGPAGVETLGAVDRRRLEAGW